MPIHRYDPRNDLMPVDVDAALARARDLLASTRANPEAVRFTLEQCEEHVTRLEALQARQQRGPNAAITALLASPACVLADRDRWPHADDLADGADLLVEAYRAWLLGRAMEADATWQEAARWVRLNGASRQNDPHARALHWLLRHATVPFPVGKACPVLRDGFPAAAARALLPFDDDATAALVLTVPVGDRPATVFFLARREPFDVVIDGEVLPGPDHCVIDGMDVRTDPPRPRGFSDTRGHARAWWQSLAGRRIDPGHRNRQRDRSPRQLVDALMDHKAANGPEPPTLEQFLNHALADREDTARRTTWRRLSRDWDVSWPELRQAIYGNMRRKRRYIDRG